MMRTLLGVRMMRAISFSRSRVSGRREDDDWDVSGLDLSCVCVLGSKEWAT
jgi:hypothetical protein